MAYHPGTGALYVPFNLNCETAAFAPVERPAGGGGGGAVRGRLHHFHPQAPDQLGEFQALDLRTGETSGAASPCALSYAGESRW